MILEGLADVELSDEDVQFAIIEAKLRKKAILEKEALLKKIEYNRQQATAKWGFDVIQTFMVNRHREIFKNKKGDPQELVLDDYNHDCFDLMCYYFIGDEENFLKKCRLLQVEDASINKGLLLAGNVGTGKTRLMDLFRRNNRQVYFTRHAKNNIVDEFNKSGGKNKEKEIPPEYLEPFKLSINDFTTFYQPLAGLCIDDIGSERIKKDYGNTYNVIGDLIDQRHLNKYYGLFLHGTTNLSADDLKIHYGERLLSRFNEMFNWIILEGPDRRR